jgi:HK97 family phage major capsid protein
MLSTTDLRSHEQLSRAGEFAAVIRHLARANGKPIEAAAMAQGARAPARVVDVLQKAAVGPDSTFDNPDGRLLLGAFVDALRHTSIFYRLLADSAMTRLPFDVVIGSIATAAGAAIVDRGEAIPVRSMALEQATLQRRKAAALVALTKELLDAGGTAAEGLLTRSLRASVSEAVDADFLTNVVLSGVSATNSTTDALADLAAMLTTVALAEESRPYFLASPSAAIKAATVASASGGRIFPEASPTGGAMLNIPMIVSSQVTSGNLILVDAARFAGASDTIEIAASRSAALEMRDDPTMSVDATSSPGPNPVHANTVSMWQTNSVAVRAIAYFGAARLRSGGVAAIDQIAWGEGSP